MASDLNSIIIEGRLVAEPQEIALKSDGFRLMKGRIASNKYYMNGEEWAKKTTFITLKAWNAMGEELLAYSKGDKLRVIGALETEEYTVDEKTISSLVLNVQHLSIVKDQPKVTVED